MQIFSVSLFKALQRFLLLEANFPHLIPTGLACAPPAAGIKPPHNPPTNHHLPPSPHQPLRILVLAGPHIETQVVSVNFRFHICDVTSVETLSITGHCSLLTPGKPTQVLEQFWSVFHLT